MYNYNTPRPINMIHQPINMMPPYINMIPRPIPYPNQIPLFIQPMSPIYLRPRIMIPMDRYLRKINSTQNKPLDTIYNSILSKVNYIGIILINSDGILFIKDIINDIWKIPHDKKGITETDDDTISRIFKNTINIELDQDKIISNDNYIRMHRNGQKSKIYVIRTKQEIDISLEDKEELIFIPLKNLKELIRNDIPYKQVDKIMTFNKSLFNDLINKI